MRNHRLRERRLKLGLTQFELGCIAGFRSNPANYVGIAERGMARNDYYVPTVRRALIWLETERRRQREIDRVDAALAGVVDLALAAPRSPRTDALVVDRLVDLLWDGRVEDFDTLAARVDLELVKTAGDRYLDGFPS